MSQGRDDAGRFTETVTEQNILRVFDYEDDPVLTASEVTEGLRRLGKDLTRAAVRYRLEQMNEAGLLSRKQFGARAVGWWAEVAPELDGNAADLADERKGSDDWISL